MGVERHGEAGYAKRDPLADSEQAREGSGIVERNQGKGKKEEEGNREYQPGYR